MLGKPLFQIYGKQAASRIPNLPAYGRTQGSDRKFENIFYQKAKNLAYVSPLPTPSPDAFACVHCLSIRF
jgi:hypothetical protein